MRFFRIGPHLLLAAVTAVFILFRVWSASSIVFSQTDQVLFLGVDPYFHVRHAEYSANNFPDLLRVDPGAHYPTHHRQQASGLFNLLIAGTAIVGSGFSPTRSSVEVSAAWIPVVLALLALLTLFWLGNYLGGYMTGFFAATIFTVYPGSTIYRSLLGFADQHVAEFFLAILSVACLVKCLCSTSDKNFALRWRPALLLGAPFAAFFYTWMGTPLYIAIFATTVFITLLLALDDDSKLETLACGFFRYFSGVAILQLLVIAFWPDLIMEVVPNMRWWNLSGMLALAIVPWIYIRTVFALVSRGMKPWMIAVSTVLTTSVLLYMLEVDPKPWTMK